MTTDTDLVGRIKAARLAIPEPKGSGQHKPTTMKRAKARA